MDKGLRKESNISSSTQSLRRRYPQDKFGAKDEWGALVRHQAEVENMIAKYKNDVKKLNQQHLQEEYKRDMQRHMQEKQTDLLIKQREAELVGLGLQQYRNDLMREKHHSDLLKNHIAQTYTSNILNKKALQQESKANRIAHERQDWDQQKRLYESEHQLNNFRKEAERQLGEGELQRHYDQLRDKANAKFQDGLHVKKLIKEQEDRLDLREHNYKKFYKLVSENQDRHQEIHEKHVLIPQIEKDQAREALISERMHNEKVRLMKSEQERNKYYQDMNNQAKNIWDAQLGFKNANKQMQELEKQNRLNEVIKDNVAYQEYLLTSNVQKQNQQEDYRRFLDLQSQEDKLKKKASKMTDAEKRLNFNDLQAYKVNDPRQFVLVPGLIHSKYTSPLGSHFAYNNLVKQTPPQTFNGELSSANKRSSQMAPEVDYAFTNDFDDVKKRRVNRSCERMTQARNFTSNGETQQHPHIKPNYFSIAGDKFSKLLKNNMSNIEQGVAKPLSLDNTNAPRTARPSQDNIVFSHGQGQNQPTEKSIEVGLPRQQSTNILPLRNIMTDLTISTPAMNKREHLVTINSRVQTEKNIFSPHNPILHPLSGNIQNPYIMKEIKRLVEFKQALPTGGDNNKSLY